MGKYYDYYSDHNSYYGKDGGRYRTPFEKKAADTRYDQQERLIKQMKRQNDILEKGYSNIDDSDYVGEPGGVVADVLLAILTLPFRPLINKWNKEALNKRHNDTEIEPTEQIHINFTPPEDK